MCDALLLLTELSPSLIMALTARFQSHVDDGDHSKARLSRHQSAEHGNLAQIGLYEDRAPL